MFLSLILNLFFVGFSNNIDAEILNNKAFFQTSQVKAEALEHLSDNDFDKEHNKIPRKVDKYNLGIETTAKSAIVVDAKNGYVLFQKEVERKQPIASLTKLMTALVFLDHNPGWGKEIIISKEDENKEVGHVYVYRGESVKVKDLFYLSLIGSDNRAAKALARSTGLSSEEFVKEMNKKAYFLGLKNTSFAGPTGLNTNNISTAFEISKLAYHAFNVEEIREAVASKNYTLKVGGKVRNVKNTNKLLDSFLDIKAGKTGYIDEAGYCLAVESVGKNGEKLIAVVLGSSTINKRFQETKGLINWAFDNYKWE